MVLALLYMSPCDCLKRLTDITVQFACNSLVPYLVSKRVAHETVLVLQPNLFGRLYHAL